MENENVVFAKRCIAQACIELMKEKDFQDITITEICQKSGYSRMAYYRHFESKNDILPTYMRIIADEFQQEVLKKMPQADSRSYEILLYSFRYFKNLHEFVECLAKANLTSILQYGLNYYMDTYLAGSEADMSTRYSLYYYAGGIFNLYSIWILTGMKESCEEMAQIVFERMHKKYEVISF